MSNIEGFTNTQKIKEEAAEWLLLIEQASPLSAEQTQSLNDWVATSLVHRSVIIGMSKTWKDMDVLAAMRIDPKPKSWSYISKIRVYLGAKILTNLANKNKQKVQQGYSLPARVAALATCFMLSILVFNYTVSDTATTQDDIYATAVGEYTKHILDDGSTLWLNSNSKVKVNYTENFRRIALIQGEAHFDVKKDATRPFEVYSMNQLVRAVGTSFSVYKRQENIEVTVSEGIVELAIVEDVLVLTPDALINTTKINLGKSEESKINSHDPAAVSQYIGKLSAGQKVSIPISPVAQIGNTEEYVVQLDRGEMSRNLAWLDGKLVFAGETLEEVITEISRHTSIIIDIPDPELRKLQIGGHFKAGETDKLFSIFESGFGLVVKKIGENHVELLIAE